MDATYLVFESSLTATHGDDVLNAPPLYDDGGRVCRVTADGQIKVFFLGRGGVVEGVG